MKIVVELHWNKNPNLIRLDFKYGFRKKCRCRIPTDSDSESVTSLYYIQFTMP